MSFTLNIHPDIVDDITEIAIYLNTRDPGLGDDFVIAVDDTLDQLEKELSNGQKTNPSFRKYFIA